MIRNNHNWEYNLYVPSMKICSMNSICRYILENILFQKNDQVKKYNAFRRIIISCHLRKNYILMCFRENSIASKYFLETRLLA